MKLYLGAKKVKPKKNKKRILIYGKDRTWNTYRHTTWQELSNKTWDELK